MMSSWVSSGEALNTCWIRIVVGQIIQMPNVPVWVQFLGSLKDRCTKDQCFWSVVSTNAEMAPIYSKWRGPEANGTTQTHCNSPVRRLTLFGHIARMDDNTDAKRILSTLPPEDWRRPRGCPASHGWAPYSRIWDAIISHCLKQWIWPRTGLCGGCGRRMALPVLSCMPETMTTRCRCSPYHPTNSVNAVEESIA